MSVRALIPRFPGTNCHWEMKHAFELAGAEARIVGHRELCQGREHLWDCDLVGLSGGFSFGDHFGAGVLAALECRRVLFDQLVEVARRNIPIIGVCNGFQILVGAGLLPGEEHGRQTAILDLNESARFEHWLTCTIYIHEPKDGNSLWVKGLHGAAMTLPVANAEGRFVPMGADPRVIATYGSMRGTTKYPASPSGSVIAAVCDETGRIAGFMPHLERRVRALHGGAEGLLVFKNGVDVVR